MGGMRSDGLERMDEAHAMLLAEYHPGGGDHRTCTRAFVEGSPPRVGEPGRSRRADVRMSSEDFSDLEIPLEGCPA